MKTRLIHIVLFFISQTAFSQKELFYKHFEFEDEFSDASVYGIIEDEYHQILIATSEGLFKFSSNEFLKIPVVNAMDNEVFNLFKHGTEIRCNNLSGQLGVLKNDSLFFHDLMFEGKRLISLYTKYDETTNVSYTVVDGNFYQIDSNYSLQKIKYSDTTIVVLELSNGNPIYTDVINGLVIIEDKVKEKLIDLTIEEAYDYNIYKLTEDFFILYSKNNADWYEVSLKNNRKTIKVNHSKFPLIYSPYYNENINCLFLSTPNGVFTYKNIGNDSLQFNNLLINGNDILCSYMDKYGVIWFGSKNKGLYKLSNKELFKLKKQNIIEEKINYLETGNTHLYIGLVDGSVFTYNNHEGLILRHKPKVKDIIRKINETNNGFRVYGDINVYKYDLKTKIVNKEKIIAGIKNFYKYNDTINILVLGHATLLDYTNTSLFLDYTVYNGRVSSTFLTDSGLYLGTFNNGLFYFDLLTKKLKKINVVNDLNIKKKTINDIVYGSDGNLWVAIADQGVFQLRNDSLIQYTTKSQAYNPKKIIFYKENLWVGTEKGLFLHNIKTNKACFFHKYNDLNQNNVVDLALFNDSIYLTEGNEILTFYAGQKNIIQPSPTLIKEEIEVNNQSYNHTLNTQLTITNQEPLIVKYKLAHHGTIPNEKIAYRIIGFDTSWIISNENPVIIEQLPLGNYTVELATLDDFNKISNNRIKIKIKVSQLFWNSPWFYLIIILLTVAVVALIMRFRQKKRLQLKDEELKKVMLLRELNELKMKSLQSQMNPHFIFNALNSIQSLLFDENPKLAVLFLSKFAKLVRGIFDNSDKYQVTIDEEISFLENYIKLEELRFEDVKSKVICNVDPGIKIPPLIIQPIVENSFKHGFFHKKGEKELLVKFSKEGNLVIVEVQDNGIGRQKLTEIRSKSSINYHLSSSLKIVKERIKIYNKIEGDFFDVIDLKDNLGNPQGTKTVIKFVINPNQDDKSDNS